jgi:16S rRNA (guanine966-N2)-methyltransferase
MRIVSGKWRSKRIMAPKDLPSRPTTDFGKEALFNILNNRYYFEDLRVLDLFAGTGNISYEFASRGTLELTCVDMNKQCVRFISKTAEELGVDIQTVQGDALMWVRRAVTQYDIVFADPPYDFEGYEELATAIIQNELIAEGGEAIIEHSDQTDLSHLPGFVEHRRYGHVNFSFFNRPEEIEAEEE